MTNKEKLDEAIRIAGAISMNSSLEDLEVAEDAAYNISCYADLVEQEMFDEIYAAMEVRGRPSRPK